MRALLARSRRAVRAIRSAGRRLYVSTLSARTPRSGPPCPKCREASLVEWDAVLRRYVCDCCSHQWVDARPVQHPA